MCKRWNEIVMGNLAEMIYSCEMLQFHADALSRGMNWASISLDFFLANLPTALPIADK